MSALSPSQQPTVLFSIYQNNTWTIRRLVDEMIDPAYHIEDCQIYGENRLYKMFNQYFAKFDHSAVAA